MEYEARQRYMELHVELGAFEQLVLEIRKRR